MTKTLPYKNRSLKNIPGEKWKDIPGYQDYYQVSNYGRAKALERWVERLIKGNLHLKEKIKKLTLNRSLNPYIGKYTSQLFVSLSRDAKDKSFTVSRLVYYCFVKKFDTENPKLIITTKDGNNLNLHYKNLQLVSKGEVQVKTYSEQKKRKLYKTISQYNYNGKLIKTYSSIIEAAAETNTNMDYLSQAACGNVIHVRGCLWRYGIAKKIRPTKFPYRNIKRVAQYTAKGKQVQQFNSITEAEKTTGFDDIGISDCAHKRRKTYKGFIWKFRD